MNTLTLTLTSLALFVGTTTSALYSLGLDTEVNPDRVLLIFFICIPLWLISFFSLFDVKPKQ